MQGLGLEPTMTVGVVLRIFGRFASLNLMFKL